MEKIFFSKGNYMETIYFLGKKINKKRTFNTGKKIGLCFMFVVLMWFEVGGAINNEINTPFLEKFEQVQITVSTGDTAWNIQSDLVFKTDVREALYHVRTLNPDKDITNIKAGDTLIFLKEIPKE